MKSFCASKELYYTESSFKFKYLLLLPPWLSGIIKHPMSMANVQRSNVRSSTLLIGMEPRHCVHLMRMPTQRDALSPCGIL